ncbi:MAG: Fic family protein [Bacteroidales bacterium]|nr:Fic family protein [Bacteroidales bacterium]
MWEELSKYRTKYLSLGLDQVIDYERFCMISIVYHSTKIEGCSLTETDTKVLLDKDITAKGKPLSDHLMVKDHFNAFLFLKEQATRKAELSIDFVKKTESILMKNTGAVVSAIGKFRLAQVYVDKKYFPDFKKVPDLIDELIKNINNKLNQSLDENDILKLAADVHYNLVNIHPFADGNGRLSRLFMNYILMYHNQAFVKIFTEDRAEYIDALNLTEENANPEIFRDFIASQQIKFFKNEIEKYQNAKKGFSLLF